MVLLDFSAAFDTVDRKILIDVLRDRFGIEQHELEGFRSLAARRHSRRRIIMIIALGQLFCNVPQGSRIGGQEFPVYTEVMAVTINSFNIGHHDSQLLTHIRVLQLFHNIVDY